MQKAYNAHLCKSGTFDLERWIDLAKIEKEYSELRDLFVKKQFMDACPKDLATQLREERSKTLDNVAEEAESFLVARGG